MNKRQDGTRHWPWSSCLSDLNPESQTMEQMFPHCQLTECNFFLTTYTGEQLEVEGQIFICLAFSSFNSDSASNHFRVV